MLLGLAMPVGGRCVPLGLAIDIGLAMHGVSTPSKLVAGDSKSMLEVGEMMKPSWSIT